MLLSTIVLLAFVSLFILQANVSTSSDESLLKKTYQQALRSVATVRSRLTPTADIHSTNSSIALKPIYNRSTSPPRRRRIAYVISMTKDGPFQDGAAVLAYSIVKISLRKDYDVSLVAFVHPEVQSSRSVLQRLGYHVIETPTPINTSAIPFTFLREKINKNGCCGAAELIKLNAYRLLQYDRVVHVDADTFFLHSIDHLFSLDASLVYTTDPNMATFKKKMEQFPVQGGFLVMRPSMEDYQNIVKVLLTTEFKIHQGWNSSKIGWYWGGMTIQVPINKDTVSVFFF